LGIINFATSVEIKTITGDVHVQLFRDRLSIDSVYQSLFPLRLID